jgi:hypothetical protein
MIAVQNFSFEFLQNWPLITDCVWYLFTFLMISSLRSILNHNMVMILCHFILFWQVLWNWSNISSGLHADSTDSGLGFSWFRWYDRRDSHWFGKSFLQSSQGHMWHPSQIWRVSFTLPGCRYRIIVTYRYYISWCEIVSTCYYFSNIMDWFLCYLEMLFVDFHNYLYWYNYHSSGHYPSSCLLFKTQHFRDWILSPSSGGTYSVGPNRQSYSLSPDTSSNTYNIYETNTTKTNIELTLSSINLISVAAGVQRQKLALCIGPN